MDRLNDVNSISQAIEIVVDRIQQVRYYSSLPDVEAIMRLKGAYRYLQDRYDIVTTDWAYAIDQAFVKEDM